MPTESIAGITITYICDECSATISAPKFVKDWTIARNPKNNTVGILCPQCSKDLNKIKKIAKKLDYQTSSPANI